MRVRFIRTFIVAFSFLFFLIGFSAVASLVYGQSKNGDTPVASISPVDQALYFSAAANGDGSPLPKEENQSPIFKSIQKIKRTFSSTLTAIPPSTRNIALLNAKTSSEQRRNQDLFLFSPTLKFLRTVVLLI